MIRPIAVRRTLAALAAAPLLLVGLAACGEDPSTATTSATDPAAAPVAALAPGDDVDPGELAARLAAGFEQMSTAHVTMSAELGAGGTMTGEGDADYSGDRPAAAMTVTSEMASALTGSDRVEVRLVDGAMYLNLGKLSHDEFWKLDLDDPDSPLGSIGAQLDPQSAVGLLEKGLQSVTFVGTQGSLDHYRATVDPQALLAGLGPAGHAGAAEAPKAFDYDLWLDDQDRVTRLTSTMGDLGSVEMTMSDFGADVTIEAPPADQVTEMPDMFGGSAHPEV